MGETIKLCFCPERIAEGVAYSELRSLPQICGAEDDESREVAAELFGKLAPEIMRTDFITAELVKLFNNISRYINFAVANQFALIADNFGANIYETRTLQITIILGVISQCLDLLRAPVYVKTLA